MDRDFEKEDSKDYESQNASAEGREETGKESFDFEGNSFHEYGESGSGTSRPDYAFEALGDLSKPKTRAFSIASLVLGILSLVCCCSGFLSFILGVLAIVFSVVARRHLGYFDGLSIAGMTCGIVGAVLGLLLGILSVSGWFDDIRDSVFPPTEEPGGDINNRF